MTLMIEKNDGIISVKKSGETLPIETYELTKSIDFSKLMNVLLNDELAEKVTWQICEFEKNEQENSLIKLLVDIFETYNTKVEEYKEFITNNQDNREQQ